jgi:hypothetical protein
MHKQDIAAKSSSKFTLYDTCVCMHACMYVGTKMAYSVMCRQEYIHIQHTYTCPHFLGRNLSVENCLKSSYSGSVMCMYILNVYVCMYACMYAKMTYAVMCRQESGYSHGFDLEFLCMYVCVYELM